MQSVAFSDQKNSIQVTVLQFQKCFINFRFNSFFVYQNRKYIDTTLILQGFQLIPLLLITTAGHKSRAKVGNFFKIATDCIIFLKNILP